MRGHLRHERRLSAAHRDVVDPRSNLIVVHRRAIVRLAAMTSV
jgi:hypothetical protein